MDTLPALPPSRRSRLERLVEQVRVGPRRSSIVFVTGAAGYGSTTFTRHLGAMCTPGGRIDAGAVHQLSGLPWAKDHAGDALAALLPGPFGGARDAAGRLVDALDQGACRWDAVWLVLNAHLVDRPSIEALVSATRLSSRAAILLVLDWTEPCRDAAPLSTHTHEDPAEDNLYDDVRTAADHLVELRPLTVDDATVLAEQAGVPLAAPQVTQLLRHTGGNTRSVVDLLRDVLPTDWGITDFAIPAPSGVRRAVRARLATLSPDALELLAAVAVLEEADQLSAAVELNAAAAVAGVDPSTRLLAEVRTSGLIVALDTSAGVVRMRDAVTRCALLEELDLAHREQLHTRAAEVVDDRAAQLRHRWFASRLPDDGLADEMASEAAHLAGSGAWAASGDLLGLAARATSDPELAGNRLLEAADAQVGAGDVAGATQHLAELESLRETPLRNAVLGYLAVVRGRSTEAESRLDRAWELVNPRRDPGTASLVAQRYVLHRLAGAQAGQVVSWADRAMELAPPDSPTAVEAAAIRELGRAVVDSPGPALRAYEELAAAVPPGAVQARVQMASGWLHLAQDHLDLAHEALERAAATDHLGGSLRISLWARAWLARVQFLSGDWADALHTATRGAALAEQSGMTLLVPLQQWTRVQVHTLRGEWALADACLRQQPVGERDYPIMRVPSALARAAWHEARADYPAVVRTLAFLTEPWAQEWIASPGFWPWADVYANALVVTGRLAEADEFLLIHEGRAAEVSHTSTTARLAYARGRWHGQHGDLDAARERFATAVDLLARVPLPYDLARAHFALGQTLRRAGRRAEADTELTDARDQFAALGAVTYVLRCERELAAGGVNVPRPTGAPDTLTPQESAVATLVAQGRANKEVAAELFLSVKTVQYHLTRIYAKLGIRSRSQLAARWAADAAGPGEAVPFDTGETGG